jgi:hypothetical protein
VKIWPFVWKFDFHWIFVWNMLNVWKYGYFCETLTFIGYLCEICSMYENMVTWCLGSASEALCSVSNEHYTESGYCSVSDKEKERHLLIRRVSHPMQRETRVRRRVSLLLNYKWKILPTEYSPWDNSLSPQARAHLSMYAACAQTGTCVPTQEAPRGGQAIRDLRSPLTVVGLKAGEHEF